ncbi:MAG: leucine-rich repeat domain-containing protein [Tannerellaceae bacterium]|nr:leucine-rich repeat domain-containing protein [Tannerellaceae bacterium]
MRAGRGLLLGVAAMCVSALSAASGNSADFTGTLWWAVDKITTAASKNAGSAGKSATTFAWPVLAGTGDGEPVAATESTGDAMAVKGAAPFSFTVKITKAPTGDPAIGEAELVKILPATFNLADAQIPEFVWVELSDASDGEKGKYAVYRVKSLGADFFKGLTTTSIGHIYVSPGVPEIKADLSSVTFSASGLQVTVRPTWQSTTYTGHEVARTDPTNTYAGRNEGACYWGHDGYVDGAEQVASYLSFKGSKDARDLKVTAADLEKLATSLKGKTSYTLEIEGGNESTNNKTEITLEDGTLAAKGLADVFPKLRISWSVKGDLGKAGFTKYRKFKSDGTVDAPSTKLEVTLANVGLYKTTDASKGTKTGIFKLEGDSLFAGIGDLTLVVPQGIETIGKAWFAGTKITSISDRAGNFAEKVTSIGESAFEEAELILTSDQATTLHFSAVKTIKARAFYGGTIGVDNSSTTYPRVVFAHTTYGFFGSDPNVEEIGDSAFANFGNNISGFEELKKIKKLGTGIFKWQSTPGQDTKKEIRGKLIAATTNGVLTLNYPELTSASKEVFGGAGFYTDGGTITEYPVTAIQLGTTNDKKLAKPESVDKDAFGKVTVSVPFEVWGEWKAKLTGAEAVTYYGNAQPDKPDFIRIINKNGKEQGSTGGVYKIKYGERTQWTLSFAEGDGQGVFRYSIEGFTKVDGFTTPEITDISNEIWENGIDVTGARLPAGLYIIKVYRSSGETALATELLEVMATPLEGTYEAKAVTVPFAGRAHLKAQLEAITEAEIVITDEDGKKVELQGLKKGTLPEDLSKVKIGLNDKLLTLEATGNMTGTIYVPVLYDSLDINKEGVLGKLPDVTFTLNAKDFTLKGKKVTIHSAHDFEVGQDDSTEAYVTIEYKGSTNKVGTVNVVVTGHGALYGSKETSYQITADWAQRAVIDTENGYELGKEITYNGLPLENFKSLVKPLLLDEDEYKVVAIKTPANDETYNSLEEGVERFTAMHDTGSFDFYIIPIIPVDGDDTYGNAAAYVGNLVIHSLKLDDLKAAALISKSFTEPENEEEEAEETYVLAFDTDVFIGKFKAEFDKKAMEFSVSISSESAKFITGLVGSTFTVAIPTADPSELKPVYPYRKDGNNVYLLVGESIDLNDYVEADSKAKIDYKEFIVWTSDKPYKLVVDGSVLTAEEEWNGTATGEYLDADGKVLLSVKINIRAVLNEDEIPHVGNSVIISNKEITFTNSALTLKGFAGKTASVYTLNGGTVVTFAVNSDDTVFPLNLSQGFYLVKVGNEVSKFIVK